MRFEEMSVSTCSCNKCKQMCINSPCFGTPEDILKLKFAGHGDALLATAWVDLQWNGIWPVVAPIKLDTGCIFLTENGLCKLHSTSLKPSEGRIAIHDNPDPEKLRRIMCFTWINQVGLEVLKMFNADIEFLNRLSDLRKAYSR